MSRLLPGTCIALPVPFLSLVAPPIPIPPVPPESCPNLATASQPVTSLQLRIASEPSILFPLRPLSCGFFFFFLQTYTPHPAIHPQCHWISLGTWNLAPLCHPVTPFLSAISPAQGTKQRSSNSDQNPANQPNLPAQRRQIVSPHTYRPSTPKKEAKGLRSKRGGGICGVPPAQRSNERLCTPTLNLHQQITTPERPLLSLSLSLTHTYPLSLNPLLPVPVLVPYRTLLFGTVPTCALSTAPPKTPNNNLYSSPRLDSLRLTPKAHLNLTSPPRILSTALSSPSIARTINHPDFDFSTPISIVTSPIRHLRIRQ
ncbi:uncharacterized protein CLUP02_18295 [Colletotrichum lupini]|uniref:Uncharacterized protein n=1 Tax=Colletotrichum lupini TaxID=145971 RepID=A0A9Q8SGY8_9PEZI|nr:uncharacterized protein CLUP02_18295 [Colletotrichum lupini]UQC76780.1 hypothetical protein CLUP02_18295 [Colletotrichum lupini]